MHDTGTLNLDGNLVVEVTKEREDFLIARVERLIEELKERPSEIGRVADRIASFFIPVVAFISSVVLLYWIYKGDFSTGMMRMLTVVLISCPCAFGISAPLALWRGLSEGLKRGVVIKVATYLKPSPG